VQLDSDKSYSALVYGTSAVVAIWISSIVVSALDSVPLVCNSHFSAYVIIIFLSILEIAVDKYQSYKIQIIDSLSQLKC
jgi:hypothetical protein